MREARFALPSTQRYRQGMEIDDRWIAYLFEAVQSGSVRAAADKLDVNPSAVSRQISQLEGRLGVSLIERHNKGVRATEAGLVLLEYHSRRKSDQADTLARVGELQNLRRGNVSLALGEGFLGLVGQGALSRFWQAYPQISMQTDVVGTNDVVRMLIEDSVHIGMLYNPPREARLRSHVAVRQPVAIIVGAGHPLASATAPLGFEDLRGHRVAQLQHAFGIRQILDTVEEIERIRLPKTLTTSSIAAMKDFVEHSGGVALLPGFTVAREIAEGRFVEIATRYALLDGHAHVVTRAGRELPLIAKNLLRFLIGELQALARKG